MSFSLALDLDGVIFDTKEAVLAAYEAAGVPRSLMEQQWGKSWAAWGERHFGENAKALHQAKTRHYVSQCKNLEPLAPAFLQSAIGVEAKVLTSASKEAAEALLGNGKSDLNIESLGVHSASPQMKAAFIAKNLGPRGVYIDDNLELGTTVMKLLRDVGYDGWYLLHYAGQSLDELVSVVQNLKRQGEDEWEDN